MISCARRLTNGIRTATIVGKPENRHWKLWFKRFDCSAKQTHTHKKRRKNERANEHEPRIILRRARQALRRECVTNEIHCFAIVMQIQFILAFRNFVQYFHPFQYFSQLLLSAMSAVYSGRMNCIVKQLESQWLRQFLSVHTFERTMLERRIAVNQVINRNDCDCLGSFERNVSAFFFSLLFLSVRNSAVRCIANETLKWMKIKVLVCAQYVHCLCFHLSYFSVPLWFLRATDVHSYWHCVLGAWCFVLRPCAVNTNSVAM